MFKLSWPRHLPREAGSLWGISIQKGQYNIAVRVFLPHRFFVWYIQYR
jgi:hypothetical protein